MTPQEFTESTNTSNPDRLKAFAGLLGDVSMLITEIEASHNGIDAEAFEKGTLNPSHTFSFEIIGEHKVEIPHKIAKLIPDIDQITVTIGQDDATAPSYISVDLISPIQTATLSRSGNPEDEPEFDQILHFDTNETAKNTITPFKVRSDKDILHGETDEEFARRIIAINKISRKEFNTLLASLVYPNEDRDYTAFERADLTSRDVFDSLKESFQLAALNNTNASMYEFSQSDTKFSYFKSDEQPLSFTIRYPEEKTGRIVVAHSNLETDFRLKFNTYEEVSHTLHAGNVAVIDKNLIDEAVPYYPTTDELQYVRSLLATEIVSMSPITTANEASLVDETTPDQALETSGRDTLIMSDVYIQNMLNRLDGDAQNPGAA